MEAICTGLISLLNQDVADTTVNNGQHDKWLKGALKFEFNADNHSAFDNLPVTVRNMVESPTKALGKVVITEHSRLALSKAVEGCESARIERDIEKAQEEDSNGSDLYSDIDDEYQCEALPESKEEQEKGENAVKAVSPDEESIAVRAESRELQNLPKAALAPLPVQPTARAPLDACKGLERESHESVYDYKTRLQHELLLIERALSSGM
jgi:hypothetical protein